MRCACCGRSINPLNAVNHVTRFEWGDGSSGSKSSNYGPVCAVRLGYTNPKPKRKPSRFAIFRTSKVVKVDDDRQDQLFGVLI